MDHVGIYSYYLVNAIHSSNYLFRDLCHLFSECHSLYEFSSVTKSSLDYKCYSLNEYGSLLPY